MAIWYLFGIAALIGAFPHIVKDVQAVNNVVPMKPVAMFAIGLTIVIYVPQWFQMLALDNVSPVSSNPVTNALDQITAFYRR
jgi:hypothetical protein